MNVKAVLIVGLAGTVLGAAIAGCQTYDFEPVEPLAIAQTTEREVVISRKKKPNIMLLVDKSGSMTDPVDKSAPNCGNCGTCAGCGPCPSTCATRLTDMKSAMNGFLSQYGDTARFGLAVFPEAAGTTPEGACRAGRVVQDITVSNDVESELQGAASQINDTIQQMGRTGGLAVQGGTPTAATLKLLADNAVLLDKDRDNFVLLLTDGLPNCNPDLVASTCTCVTGAANCDQARNCLDQDAVVQSVNTLRSQDVRTIVVGFGADTGASSARGALNAMAQAGGFARSCESNQDCGAGDACDMTSKTCGVKFYQAANADELARALEKIQSLIPGQDPCVYELGATPTELSFLAVYVDGQRVTAGQDTWGYTNTGTPTVTFQGKTCDRLMNASPTSPVEVEIRVVEGL